MTTYYVIVIGAMIFALLLLFILLQEVFGNNKTDDSQKLVGTTATISGQNDNGHIAQANHVEWLAVNKGKIPIRIGDSVNIIGVKGVTIFVTKKEGE